MMNSNIVINMHPYPNTDRESPYKGQTNSKSAITHKYKNPKCSWNLSFSDKKTTLHGVLELTAGDVVQYIKSVLFEKLLKKQ